MKPNKALQAATILLIIAPLIYLVTVYGKLPQIIPTHFDMEGKPDRTGDRSQLILISGFFAFITFGVVLLLWNIKKIDPKRAATQSPVLLGKIAFALAMFLCIIHIFIIRASTGDSKTIMNYMPPLMGIFFAVLGNFMHNVKPNYFVGIRTPWTLENELVWKKTHLLGGKLWFAGGIVMAIVSLLVPAEYAMYVMVGGVMIMALVPIIYSFVEYKKLERQV